MKPEHPSSKLYQLIKAIAFEPTERGYRTREETAEFLGLSPEGFADFCQGDGWSAAGARRGPGRLKKPEGETPAGVYTDESLKSWLNLISKTQLRLLGWYQNHRPSDALKSQIGANNFSTKGARPPQTT